MNTRTGLALRTLPIHLMCRLRIYAKIRFGGISAPSAVRPKNNSVLREMLVPKNYHSCYVKSHLIHLFWLRIDFLRGGG